MYKKAPTILICLFITGIAILQWKLYGLYAEARTLDKVLQGRNAFSALSEIIQGKTRKITYTIQKNDTFSDILQSFNFSHDVVHQFVEQTKRIYPLSKINKGKTLFLTIFDNELTELTYYIDKYNLLNVRKDDNLFTGSIEKIPYVVQEKVFDGAIVTNLFDAAQEAGLDAEVIQNLVDIYQYDIDFKSSLRKNDRFTLLVETLNLKGKDVGFGKILASKFSNSGKDYLAYYFQDPDGHGDYYGPDGATLRKEFLKSPVRYTRITSSFNLRRFHPILKVRRPHMGIDYAGPVGTPIKSIGNGVVTYVGWKGGSGKFVKIKHSQKYESSYSHLSGYASGIRVGSRVRQSQVIGYMGKTGLATGPHLHFAFYVFGNYVNFNRLSFRSAEPVKKEFFALFIEARDKLALRLTEVGKLARNENRI